MHWSLLDEYSTTPKKLRSIVNHIRHTGIHVVTLQEGIRLMNTERRATLPRGPIAAGSLNRRSSMALVSRDEAQELKRAYTTLFWCGEGCAQTQEQRVDGVMLRGSCGTKERDREGLGGLLKINMQSPKALKSDVVGLMGAATLGVVMLSPAMTLYGGVCTKLVARPG